MTQPPDPLSAGENGILGTIDALQALTQAGDSHSICRMLFTERLRASIGSASKRRCADVVGGLFDTKTSISVGRDIKVGTRTASAVIRDQNGRSLSLRFVKQAGAWKIDRLTPGTSPP